MIFFILSSGCIHHQKGPIFKFNIHAKHQFVFTVKLVQHYFDTQTIYFSIVFNIFSGITSKFITFVIAKIAHEFFCFVFSLHIVKVPNEIGSLDPLRGYQGEDIEIQLPGNLTVYDIDWLAVWCVEYRHNFGHVYIPKDLDVPPALGQTKIAVSVASFISSFVQYTKCKQISINIFHLPCTRIATMVVQSCK